MSLSFEDLVDRAESIAEMLVARRQTVAVSESSTGGLIAAALLAIPGASRYFMGGAVVYTLAARAELLRISDDDMAGLRSASEPYAALAASRIRQHLKTDWALAETGASGPTGNRYGDAAGHSCFAVEGPVMRRHTLETGRDDRLQNMGVFAAAGLDLLRQCLAEAEGK